MRKLKIPENLTALAYRSIKDYILEGRLDDNSRLTEEFLSRQLGISKSPIREALNRLEAEGLIRIEPRRGAYLQVFSSQEVDDLYDLREALEVHVVRTARLTPAVFKELRHGVRRLRSYRKANDIAHFIEEDVSFHKSLAESTGNARLVRTLENLQNQIYLSRRKTYVLSATTAPDYHESILDALESNDREKAGRAMREHIGNARRKLVEFLAAQERERAQSVAV